MVRSRRFGRIQKFTLFIETNCYYSSYSYSKVTMGVVAEDHTVEGRGLRDLQ